VTELADIRKIDKVPVFLFNAEEDGMCEDDDDVKKLMKDIPSFKKKYTLSPQYDHGTFWYPVGDVADEIVGNIVKALNDDWTSEDNDYDSDNDDDL
jgi:hypothetical protein